MVTQGIPPENSVVTEAHNYGLTLNVPCPFSDVQFIHNCSVEYYTIQVWLKLHVVQEILLKIVGTTRAENISGLLFKKDKQGLCHLKKC